MSKEFLQTAIEARVSQNGRAFIPYIMAGDGGLENLYDQLILLQDAGETAVEIGIPFSDPVADGPTIQEAGKRALANDVTLKDVLKEVGHLGNEVTIPIVLMTYLNPVFQYGIEAFAKDCRVAGVSGVIVPDMPLEECGILHGDLVENDIALIQLVSLTSPVDRVKRIAEASEGFLYAVTVIGITGERAGFALNLQEHLTRLKEMCSVPVMAGFGISTPEQVRKIGQFADGVIVGSRIVEAMHVGDEQTVHDLIGAATEIVV